ncbi:MAG: polysaccharide deacetylase [Lachnospiraceae bacterium]|nr:polysaccharide deacetylase [Lachnospiraceae bacterium]
MPKNEGESANQRKSRIRNDLQIVPIILSIFAITACIILFFRQYQMQNRLYDLEAQMAILTLEHNEEMQRGSRLVDVEEDGIVDSWKTFYEDREARLAEIEAERLAAMFDPMKAAHKVYLTFDDGPSEYTEQILDILDQYNVKATFFVIGREDEESLRLYKEIVDRGHTLGMHSYSHKYADIYKNKDAFIKDFEKIYTLLATATGTTPMYYRFPGGSSNTVSKIDMHVYTDYLTSRGITYFDWNVSSGDAISNGVPVEELIIGSTSDIQTRHTSVILFHDTTTKSTTVEALPIIIETILAMEDTAILPITSDTELVQHIQ